MDLGRPDTLLMITILGFAWTAAGCGSSNPAQPSEPASAATPVASVPSTPPTPPPAFTAIKEGPKLAVSLIQLIDPLDEPEFYCVDVPGFGSGVRLQSALVVHTCKLSDAEDEMFSIDFPSAGHVYMPEYDLCMESEGSTAGSHLRLKPCSDSPLQRFELGEDATVRLGHGGPRDLCLAVAPGEGQPTGGPSHLRRDLMVQECAKTEPKLSRWRLPGTVPR